MIHESENNLINQNTAEVIADLSQKAAVQILEPVAGGIKFAVIPEDSKIESLEKFQFPDDRTPARIKAYPQMKDEASFTSYFNSYADDRARVFGDPKRCAFTGILDYHGIGERSPEFLSHRVGFQMEFEERWTLWFGKNGKPFTQAEFAEFIEDNRRDVIDPDSATMMEVARNLEAKIEVNFNSATNLHNGQAQLRYEEQVKAGVPSAGNIEVPQSFKIRIPVFYGEEAVEIEARLRFRIGSGKLTFFYHMYRPQEVVQEAFKATCARIAEKTKREVLMGSLA